MFSAAIEVANELSGEDGRNLNGGLLQRSPFLSFLCTVPQFRIENMMVL